MHLVCPSFLAYIRRSMMSILAIVYRMSCCRGVYLFVLRLLRLDEQTTPASLEIYASVNKLLLWRKQMLKLVFSSGCCCCARDTKLTSTTKNDYLLMPKSFTAYSVRRRKITSMRLSIYNRAFTSHTHTHIRHKAKPFRIQMHILETARARGICSRLTQKRNRRR